MKSTCVNYTTYVDMRRITKCLRLNGKIGTAGPAFSKRIPFPHVRVGLRHGYLRQPIRSRMSKIENSMLNQRKSKIIHVTNLTGARPILLSSN